MQNKLCLSWFVFTFICISFGVVKFIVELVLERLIKMVSYALEHRISEGKFKEAV